VECIDSGVDLLDVARTAFHAEELSRVRLSANPDDAQTAFYGCWTRKEAILKADGRGLSLEPTSFVAGVDSVTEQEVVLGGKLSFHAFYVRELDVGLTHRAAIATTAAGYSPKCYEFAL
jgi:4'-phosphopantetheinyl transferase